MYAGKYEDLLADLGFFTQHDFQQRAEEGKQLLDEVMQDAMEMVENNERSIQ